MRTTRSSSRPGGCLHQALPRDQAHTPGPGTSPLWDQTPPPPGPGTPPVDRMTDTCKNITFANFVCGR